MKSLQRKTVWLGVFLVLLTAVGFTQNTQRLKLMAKRHAMADAYRMMAERIGGVDLTANGDFTMDEYLTQTQEVRAQFDGFIKGAQLVREIYHEQGLYEVEIELPIQELETWWTSVRKHGPDGTRYKLRLEDYDVKTKVFRVRGFGPVQGTDGEKMFQSYRAGVLDVYNQLAEKIMGLHISSDSYVKDMALEYDSVKTSLAKELKGTRLTNITWKKDLSCEIDGELTLQQTVAILSNLHRHHDSFFRHGDYRWEKMELYTQDKIVTAQGNGFWKERGAQASATENQNDVPTPGVVEKYDSAPKVIIN